MNIVLFILTFISIAAAFYFYNIITGKVKDIDGDFIPDVIEDKVKEVKRRAKAVKKEVVDVKKATKKVAKEAKDVVDAVKKPAKKRGRPVGSKNKKKNKK